MKKTMFKKVFAGIAAVFTLGLCVPTGFTGTDLKPSFEATAAPANYNDNLQPDENGVLTVPQRTTIKNGQFRKNVSIKEVKISNNCTIEGNAFGICTALESVEIGNGCTIGERAFQTCKALESVTIGNSCTIGERAFWDCKALESVMFGDDCTIAKSAFYSCNNIQEVIYTDSKDSVTVEKTGNPEIIYNKDKWTMSSSKCSKCSGCLIDYKCTLCGYFDKAAAQAEIEKHEAVIKKRKAVIGKNKDEIKKNKAEIEKHKDEIDRIQKLIDRNTNKKRNKTASTFSDGSILAVIGGSTFLIFCGLAAVIIVKRRKKTE